MTLVELLVVVVLITVLVSTAIPVISPGGDDRKIREASRNLNAYLQGAQARAQETGRPFGVALRRLSAATGRGEDNAVSSVVEYVEVPPHFTGFGATSSVRFARSLRYAPAADAGPVAELARDESDDVGPLWVQFVARGGTVTGLPPGWAPDLVPPAFLRPGDTLEVHGQRYTLLDRNRLNTTGADPTARAIDLTPTAADAVEDGATNLFFPGSTQVPGGMVTLLAVPEGVAPSTPVERLPPLVARYDLRGGSLAASSTVDDAPFWTEPSRYRILRQPVPAGGEPLELPSGVAIDLQASVFGTGQRLYSPHVDAENDSATSFRVRPSDVLVLFSPQGGIERVHGVVAIEDGADDTSAGDDFGPTLAPTTVTSYLALCVGRRELIPAKPVGAVSKAAYKEPIDLYRDVVQPGLSETEARELTDQYNWLNLDSRWVLVAGTTGAVSTVESRAVFTGGVTAPFRLNQQLAGTLDAVPRRVRAGGR